jgi:outer membrane murein-binding lipoprotein Lpp
MYTMSKIAIFAVAGTALSLSGCVTRDQVNTAQATANQALAQAQAAQQTANAAQSAAQSAQQTASAAQQSANQARPAVYVQPDRGPRD